MSSRKSVTFQTACVNPGQHNGNVTASAYSPNTWPMPYLMKIGGSSICQIIHQRSREFCVTVLLCITGRPWTSWARWSREPWIRGSPFTRFSPRTVPCQKGLTCGRISDKISNTLPRISNLSIKIHKCFVPHSYFVALGGWQLWDTRKQVAERNTMSQMVFVSPVEFVGNQHFIG